MPASQRIGTRQAAYGFDVTSVVPFHSGDAMSTLRFDVFIMFLVAAAAIIALVYGFMLAIPRNDDEHTHDSLSAPQLWKTRLLRTLVRLKHRFSR
jgi:hypothetical protein